MSDTTPPVPNYGMPTAEGYTRVVTLTAVIENILRGVPGLTVPDALSVGVSLVVTVLVRGAESGHVAASQRSAREIADVLAEFAAAPDAVAMAAIAADRAKRAGFAAASAPTVG